MQGGQTGRRAARAWPCDTSSGLIAGAGRPPGQLGRQSAEVLFMRRLLVHRRGAHTLLSTVVLLLY